MSPRSGMRREDDGPLVRRAVDGCVDSFAARLARHQVPVAHHFVRQMMGGDSADVHDVVQEVFLRAHRRLADYDDRWAFSTWLFTIARRCCINHARAERRRRRRDVAVVRPEATAAEADPQAVAMAFEAGASLWAAARVVLTERQFTALWLWYIEDLAVDVPRAGLDALPSFDELGAGVADGIGSLAATVVGLPDWRELAVAELPIVDAWPGDRETGFAAATGSAGPRAVR